MSEELNDLNQNEDQFIDASTFSDGENENKKEAQNPNVDLIVSELTTFAETMHARNQHKKKVCIWCMVFIPLLFMVLMFTMTTAKVVYLLLWVISLFMFCAYLIIVDYIDDKLTRKLDELNIEIQATQAQASLSENIKTFLSEVKL